jgi:hypothetical protein
MIPEKTQYIRLFPPFFFKKGKSEEVIEREQKIWKSNSLLKEKFFFGLNFIAKKA